MNNLKLNIKNISRVMTAVYILCLIPLLWISWYNYPSADDFSMGYRAYSEYVSSGGNVFSAIWGALYMAWYDYFNWMGYFSSTFLMQNIFCLVMYLTAFVISALTFTFLPVRISFFAVLLS